MGIEGKWSEQYYVLYGWFPQGWLLYSRMLAWGFSQEGFTASGSVSDPMIFRFKIGQFPFHTLTNSFDSQFLPVSLPFSHFHTKITLVLWVFSSILLSMELLLTQETCSHWKFCFKPQIPLRFPVKTENHWLLGFRP